MSSTRAHLARSVVARAGILSTICLAPSLSALADGGAGGLGLPAGAGGVGGTGTSGNSGGNGVGAEVSGGGGGGGGAGGGRGGNGGGSGNNSGGVNGPGNNGGSLGGGGGGGAGGLNGGTVQTLNNSTLLVGGSGFAGGLGSSNVLTGGVGGGGGGGGGAGGYGIVVTGDGTATNTGLGALLGGNGGAGGRPGGAAITAQGGGGGDGGVGANFSAAGVSFTNSGSISGGNGGAGGSSNGTGVSAPGDGGSGGIGVNFSSAGAALNNSGAITGGNGGAGGASGTVNLSTSGSAGAAGIGVNFSTAGGSLSNSGVIVGGNGAAGASSRIIGAGGAGVVGAGLVITNGGTIGGGLASDGATRANAITFSGGSNALTLLEGSNIQGNVVAAAGTATLGLGGSADSTFDSGQLGSVFQGFSGFMKAGTSTWTLTGNAAVSIPWTIGSGTLSISADGNLGAPNVPLTFAGGTLQTTASFSSTRTAILLGATNTFDTVAGTSYSWNSSIAGPGGLTKTGAGTLILAGVSSYAGGTTVSAGILQGDSSSLQGNILNNASLVFNQTGIGTYAGAISGFGVVTLQGGGQLIMTGASTYTGSTWVNAGKLIVNGRLAGDVFVSPGASFGGTGSIGSVLLEGAFLSPGNSIGTLTVNGAFTHNGGVHQLELNGAGASDRVNVGSIARINGATVQLLAASGSYATTTTYTILNAAGGLGGTYAGVSDNLAFLTPTLSYDANNAYLTLALQGAAFAGGSATANQRAAGFALDRSYANAGGDFAMVIGALAGLDNIQGPWALNQISGQQYANFGTVNVANNALFMNALGQQMALARGSAVGGGQRQALAQACDVATCGSASPFNAWASALGGLGQVLGNGNSSTFSYNVGGAAAGIDYRLDPRFMAGIAAGYTNGTQWANSFMGKGWSDTVSVAAYGSYTTGDFYVDALAGYAYADNQMQRQIALPNLQTRTANGSTGANQFLGQAEIGNKFGIYAPAQATFTPFARFQASSINQAAFREWGANSLSLNVQQQTTTSLRSTLGIGLAGAIGLGDTRTLDLGLRLGWLHEYASTARPLTAAFAGAPAANFTVYGATPRRDSAMIGFSASTDVAAATRLYLRYDGEVTTGSATHALTAGLRLSW